MTERRMEWLFWTIIFGGSITIGFALCLIFVRLGWVKP